MAKLVGVVPLNFALKLPNQKPSSVRTACPPETEYKASLSKCATVISTASWLLLLKSKVLYPDPPSKETVDDPWPLYVVVSENVLSKFEPIIVIATESSTCKSMLAIPRNVIFEQRVRRRGFFIR